MIVLGGTRSEQAAKKRVQGKGALHAGAHRCIAGGGPVSFGLEPTADGFRNYFGDGVRRSPAEMLVDRASNLMLTVPEMTVLVGGMRALNANAGQTKYGIFTDRPGTLTNDFFVNLLDMSYAWNKSAASEGIYEGHDRTGASSRTPVDLAGSNRTSMAEVSLPRAARRSLCAISSRRGQRYDSRPL